ncbi:MAG: N-acetylmuramoyl-L-alanine amidase [Clostridia bacterium]|nr:N-acetylmuramoyl-L-alanine amidase [Clostridia bacterium]
MKIFVINLIGKRLHQAIISAALILTVIISSVIGITIRNVRADLIAQDAGAIPYQKIIIIDAGHGGEDSGAVGVNGALEKDINLSIALEIGRALEEKDFIVVYTRTDDRLLYTEEQNVKGIRKINDLKNRCKFAEKYPESVFVSIHMNSFGSEKYSGLQVYYSEKNEESRTLAEAIQNRVISDIQKENNRKIKPGKDMYVLENIQNTAVLIECGFLTNKVECEKLSEKEYQKELSFSIVCAIIEYIENFNQE